MQGDFKRLIVEMIDDNTGQAVAAKVASAAGSGAFLIGLTANEIAAFAGLLIAFLSLGFQVWLGLQKLKLQRIETRLKAIQKDAHAVADRLTETDLPPLPDKK
jgi:hypothetical protein